MRRRLGDFLVPSLTLCAFAVGGLLSAPLFKSGPAASSAREPRRPAAAFAAFVTLTPEQEAAAMKRVRSATPREAGRWTSQAPNPILDVLPDDPPRPLMDDDEPRPQPPPVREAFRFGAYQPSCAAPRLSQIPSDKSADVDLPFPRAALLRLDSPE